MIFHYLFAIVAIVALMLIWVLVQFAWKKTFPGISSDEDVLAGRGGCQGCKCLLICQKKVPFANKNNGAS